MQTGPDYEYTINIKGVHSDYSGGHPAQILVNVKDSTDHISLTKRFIQHEAYTIIGHAEAIRTMVINKDIYDKNKWPVNDPVFNETISNAIDELNGESERHQQIAQIIKDLADKNHTLNNSILDLLNENILIKEWKETDSQK